MAMRKSMKPSVMKDSLISVLPFQSAIVLRKQSASLV